MYVCVLLFVVCCLLLVVVHLQEFVFCRSKRDVTGLVLSSDQVIDLMMGDVHIVQYSVIGDLVAEGAVELI